MSVSTAQTKNKNRTSFQPKRNDQKRKMKTICKTHMERIKVTRWTWKGRKECKWNWVEGVAYKMRHGDTELVTCWDRQCLRTNGKQTLWEVWVENWIRTCEVRIYSWIFVFWALYVICGSLVGKHSNNTLSTNTANTMIKQTTLIYSIVIG